MRVPPIPFSRFAKGVKGVMKSLASLEMQNEAQLSIRIALESESNLATSFGLTWEALMAMMADIAFSELKRLRFCLVFTLRRTIPWGLRHRDVGVLDLEVLIRTCRLLRVFDRNRLQYLRTVLSIGVHRHCLMSSHLSHHELEC